MKDLTIGNKYMYLLVGDYFIDVLAKSHVNILHRDLYRLITTIRRALSEWSTTEA